MKHQGFTLVELSIVLVVIGLLVGGVLVGQDLIKGAEIRGTISDHTRIETAMNTFRLKHDCIAGDCPNATIFFGTNADGCPAGGSTVSGTCDGDGDKRVTWASETFRLWQMLSLAGLWEGTYTGVYGSGADIGTNVPAGSIKGTGYTVACLTWSGSASGCDKLRNDIGAANPPNATSGAGLTTHEAYSIDSKMDDGIRTSGIVRANNGTGYVVACNSGVDYNLAGEGKACHLTIEVR